MQQSFVQRMTWLHTWLGLTLGWLAFVLFLTGTIAVYWFEVSYWAQRELHGTQMLSPEATVQYSVEYFRKVAHAELIDRGGFHESIRQGLEADDRVEDGPSDPEYLRRLGRRQRLRQAIMTAMAEHELDALLYPHQRRLVAPIGEPQLERNGVLSNGTGFPAITVPGGFSAPTASAPLGVPIGIELLGPEWSESRLIALAFAFEQATRYRQPPMATPPLAR